MTACKLSFCDEQHVWSWEMSWCVWLNWGQQYEQMVARVGRCFWLLLSCPASCGENVLQSKLAWSSVYELHTWVCPQSTSISLIPIPVTKEDFVLKCYLFAWLLTNKATDQIPMSVGVCIEIVPDCVYIKTHFKLGVFVLIQTRQAFQCYFLSDSPPHFSILLVTRVTSHKRWMSR